MDINTIVETLRADLARAAGIGGEDARAAAAHLANALDPAFRLALFEALSQAASEIGAQAGGLSIDVRLHGREPVFVVSGARAAPTEADAEPDGDDAVSRITLRLPEALKARAESLAARRGQSLNTWLVAAARAAASGHDDSHGHPGRHGPGRRVRGWAK